MPKVSCGVHDFRRAKARPELPACVATPLPQLQLLDDQWVCAWDCRLYQQLHSGVQQRVHKPEIKILATGFSGFSSVRLQQHALVVVTHTRVLAHADLVLCSPHGELWLLLLQMHEAHPELFEDMDNQL